MAKITKSDRGTLKRVVERRFDILDQALQAHCERLDEEYKSEAIETIVPAALRETLNQYVRDVQAIELRYDAINQTLHDLDLHALLPHVYGSSHTGEPYGEAIEKEVERLRAADGFVSPNIARARLRERKAETLDQIDVASLTGQDCQSFLDAIPSTIDLLRA